MAGALGIMARRYTYQEFPKYFVWHADKKCWTIRKQHNAIGRMYFVSPTAGERFYLRTLLTTVKGPTSFQNLRTINGSTYPTFRETCIALGLLEDDGEWRTCLEEAAEMQTGYRLRQLFVTILLFCSPSSPSELWTQYRKSICDDLRPELIRLGKENPSEYEIYDYGLFLIGKMLQQVGRTLQEFGISNPIENWENYSVNHYIIEQTAYSQYNEQAMARDNISQLNLEQCYAYNQIIHSVESLEGRLFFLNGPGGTGKTFVYNTVCHKVRGEGWIVLCVASSGIAALLLKGGRTAHSMFKIPIDGLTGESVCSIPKESQLAAMLRLVCLIVWDEITMQHKHAAEAVERTLRDIRDNDKLFGGITVVFGGDYQQILPVVPRGSREDIVSASLQRSSLWEHIEILRLHQNMRLDRSTNSEDFAQWLLDIGHGRQMTSTGDFALPSAMQCTSLNHLIEYIYSDINSIPPPPPEYFLHRTILSPRNQDVEDINSSILNLMSGQITKFASANSIMNTSENELNFQDNILPDEFLQSITASGLPPGVLSLKIGCPIILLRNLSPKDGLCNGTRGVIERISHRVLEIRIIGGSHNNELAFIPRITLTPSNLQGEFTFILRRRQFPVRLAFTMTINKAQGQSVKYVGVDLRVPVFSHGQLYVAFSRATNSEHIKVLLPNDSNITKNIVYPEILIKEN